MASKARIAWGEVNRARKGPALAHTWMDGIDTTLIHGSIDAFGGGGIVASIEDAA